MARLPAVVINCEITLEGMTSIEFAADYSYRLSIELDHEYYVDYVRSAYSNASYHTPLD